MLRARVGEREFEWPLEYIVFGSPSSIDFDLMIKVPMELVNSAPGAHTFTQLCQVLDKYMEAILWVGLNPHKPINSSVGYWEDGELLWSQKGSSPAEVNNGIIATFNSHLQYQMFDVCPLVRIQPRNVWDKLLTTVRDLICKLSNCYIDFDSIEDEVEWIASVAHYILNIPEVRLRPRSFIHSFLSGYYIPPEILVRLPNRDLVSDMERTQPKKLLRLKTLNQIYDSPDNIDLIREVIRLNRVHYAHLENIVDVVQANGDVELAADLTKATRSGLITLNRFIDQSRKIREIGPRLDIMRIIDFTRVGIENDVADKYKTIVFKICQSLELIKGREIFSKEDLIKLYPAMTPFLKRLPIADDDLENLNQLVQHFIDVVINYPGYNRDLLEIMRV